MRKFANPVVLDNTLLSNFALTQQTGLIFDLFESPYTTEASMDEYQAGAISGKLPPNAWRRLPIVRLMVSEAAFAKNLGPGLGQGESSCIAAASSRQALLATDDRKARTTAREAGIPVTGLLGILVMGVDTGTILVKEANRILQEMIAFGFYSPVTAVETLL